MFRKNPYRSLSCFLCIALLAGCGIRPSLRGPQKLDKNYEQQLTQWTVSGQIYHSFDRVLYVHATYLSRSFRKALKDQYVKVFSIDPGKVDTDLEMIATSESTNHEFFIFIDTTEFTWNNLEDSDSVWRMALWGGDEQTYTPSISIHRFKGRGPNLKAFFPYINEFGQPYYVVFPLAQADGKRILDPEKNELTVKLASAFGGISMTWKVEK